jgi:hypothetical protein
MQSFVFTQLAAGSLYCTQHYDSRTGGRPTPSQTFKQDTANQGVSILGACASVAPRVVVGKFTYGIALALLETNKKDL